ncbi:hypothetical protein G6F46_012501 [Rhizopus delemar]|uniref:Cytochrome P450 n=2 Tax=Rhizopus TaxID=4842 RepID=A0A9P7CIC7_9FUNG|nr:hypothetical protein G6F36_013436 [Rhizopus arrhizus]KAG1444493.1 hypothetical protein G6F55_012305 [Rhizopus delemar]KAG1494943.1 hypothetical protein G6F53_012475 [Rhizopus delemar]KAG1507172.1 hypothetical protein G6F52_011702 [Rhizopus delemar]KAG1533478.1 hypothetical protein G6F51_012590 [Rhizopus arrhizus]
MENQIESYRLAIEKLLPAIQKRSKLSCITFAIALIAAQQLYSFFRVPKNLRQFPRVPYFSMVKSFLKAESPTDRYKRIIHPVASKGNGFYVSKVPFLWAVYVTNPVVAKQVLLKSDIFPKNHAVFHQIGKDSPFTQFLGLDNVALSNGDVWKKQRKVKKAFDTNIVLMPFLGDESSLPSLSAHQDHG